MNIGIISMQEVVNYGSFLQAYALKKILGETHKIGFISAYNNTKKRKKAYIKSIKKFLEILLVPTDFKRRYYRLRLKKSIMPFQKKYFDYTPIKYDAVIVGSDEVFNFAQEASWDDSIFYGEGIDAVHKYSFAASCGNTKVQNLSERKKNAIRKGLKTFSALSVRDQGTYNLLNSLGLEVESFLLDPVLLYDFKSEMQSWRIRRKEKPYMIVYSYNERFRSKKEIDEIERFAKKEGLKIFAVEGYQTWADKYIAVNPFELFSLFENAEYIVTDTFHGTIICVKLQKRFAVYIRDANNNKLLDLVRRINLEKHVYSSGQLEEIMEVDDCEIADEIIFHEKEKAQKFINKITS